jgi:hypothetical protein
MSQPLNLPEGIQASMLSLFGSGMLPGITTCNLAHLVNGHYLVEVKSDKGIISSKIFIAH